MLGKVWRKGGRRVLWVGIEIVVATMEDSEKVPQKIKNRTSLRSSNATSGHLCEGNENTNTPMFAVALCTMATYGNYLSVCRWVRAGRCGPRATRKVMQPSKEGNRAICHDMDAPGGHYAKATKSASKRQTPYGLTYMWNLNKDKNKNKTWV